MTYKEEIIKAIKMLAEKENTLFIGQSVKYPGTGLYHTIKDIPDDKKIELPIFEDTQMGMCIGLSLNGIVPVSIYPRWNFLLLATNQLVNHLDKIESMSDGQFKPFVIIRTAVGSIKPLFPGEQHTGDFSDAFEKMFKHIKIYRLNKASDIMQTYNKVMEERISAIIVEYPDLYDTE